MKLIFTLVLCFGFMFTTNTFGQEETKKVVVIKKVKDADGNTTSERQEVTGKEAEALLKKMKEDGTLDGIDIDMKVDSAKNANVVKKSITKDISVEKTIKDGKEVTKYKIVSEENGQKKVMEWNGEGEMPAEMAEIMKSVKVGKGSKIEDNETMEYEVITEDDGEKKVMFWDGQGEMPAEMAEKLKNVDIVTKHKKDGDQMMITIEVDQDQDNGIREKHEIEKKIRIKRESENKVTLGVMIEDDGQGVVISYVIAESVAQKSGLKSGDTVLKIDNTYVFNTEMLLKALSKFDKGDTVNVTFLRDGKEKTVKAKF